MNIFELAKVDMRIVYNVGDRVKLTKDCKTLENKYKKDDEFFVATVTTTTVNLYNEKGELTIHRFLSELVEKI